MVSFQSSAKESQFKLLVHSVRLVVSNSIIFDFPGLPEPRDFDCKSFDNRDLARELHFDSASEADAATRHLHLFYPGQLDKFQEI